jgi:hypothetical protein
MITNFNDFTLSHTTSHQFSPGSNVKQSDKTRLQCPLCPKTKPDNEQGKQKFRSHLAEHWKDDKVKVYLDPLYTNTASTPSAQAVSDHAREKMFKKIDENRANFG